MPNEFIAIKQAAKILGVSIQTLRKWDKKGKLLAHRNPMNNYRLYKKEEIFKLLEDIEKSTGEKSIQKFLEI